MSSLLNHKSHRSLLLLMPLALFTLLTGVAFAWQLDDDEDAGKDRRQLWQEVTKAQSEGLPETAIRKLKNIYRQSLTAKDYPEAIKALGMQLAAEGSKEDPGSVHMIQRLEEVLPESPNEIHPILKVLLADWYFSYFQQNRWRFSQRDQTAESPSDDIQTWDLPRLLSHIDSLYRDALESADSLKQIRTNSYQMILTKGNVADTHRPTLYDFVAFQALQFYQLDEQIVRQQGAFDVSADGPIFGPQQEFLNWQPQTEDEDSYLVQGIHILQELGRFHQDDDSETAALDAELQRYEFGMQTAVGSEARARYEAALQRFADQHQNHPLSCLALARLANSQYARGEYVAAHKTANVANNRFPNSVGGKMGYNLVLSIEGKELAVQAEKTWNKASADIEIRYRNVDQIHFRLIPFDYENWDQWGRYNQPQHVPQRAREVYLKRDPVKQWSVKLPLKGDYQPAHLSVRGEFEGLPSGCYLLLASGNETFSSANNVLSMTEVWVSDLTVVTRRDYHWSEMESQLMNAISGEPIKDAQIKVETWVQNGRNSRTELSETVASDSDGFFNYKKSRQQRNRLLISAGDQKLGFLTQNYYYGNNQNRSNRRAVFFTDRSIYRPGQTIHFKAVLTRSVYREAIYETVSNQRVKVALRDANNEVVEERELLSNEYGSISGSFTAPADLVTGQMRIQVEASQFSGGASVSVEEYKRPKFYTEITQPTQQFQLEQDIQVEGAAIAYTGAVVDGAKVTWRVAREVRYPAWWMWRCWYCPPNNGQSQEIANGETQTDIDGKFKVDFKAEPDRSVDRASQPIFNYTVYADVTDTTGETRSASTSIRLGYTSLQADLSVQESQWLTTDEQVVFKAGLSNLSNQGQAATGQLTVYKLQEPDEVHKAQLPGMNGFQQQVFAELTRNNVKIDPATVPADLSDYERWEMSDQVHTEEIETDASGKVEASVQLPAGAYRARLTSTDSTGNEVKAEATFVVFDPAAQELDLKVPNFFRVENDSVEPGQTYRAIWGTGYENGRAYVQWIHRGQVIKSFWTDAGQTQAELTFTPDEEHRGGLNLVVSFVHDNRVYSQNRRINVPWSNKELTVKWEHFVSKLTPGGKETWTAIVSGPDGNRAVSEMVATLYDASLDAFTPHYWAQRIGSFYQNQSYMNFWDSNAMQYMQNTSYNWNRRNRKSVALQYRSFIPELLLSNGMRFRGRSFGGGGLLGGAGIGGGGRARFSANEGALEMAEAADMAMPAAAAPMAKRSVTATRGLESESLGQPRENSQSTDVKLDNVTARKNLQETAFFFPHLVSNKEGEIRLEFEVPEALTKWNFMGLAHDSQQRSGFLRDEAVTSKDLMVQPNPPRFLREGDQLEFSVKVSNQAATAQSGKVRLSFANLQTEESMDEMLGNLQNEQSFEIPAGQSKSFYWTLNVPDFVGVLSYKAVGATEKLSDGEEGFLPVLSKRILVNESLPLPIRGNQTKDFKFDRLINSANQPSIQNQRLTVQMTSNPSWYAIMALPYLMEYPHQCNEQVFNRLYANALARHIVKSDDRIKRVFDQWRGTDALDSPLLKNQELKNVLIEQSPWLLDAKEESQARRDVGVLFDDNRLDAELRRAAQQLAQTQMTDGSWSWFPGGRANDYITLYITTGFGRLRHLNVEVDVAPAIRSLNRLDWWIDKQYKEIVRRGDLEKNNLSSTICLYLYGRSFFLGDMPVNDQYKAAFDYFVAQARLHWMSVSRQSQGHLAIALNRLKDRQTPAKIMASLTERSKSDEEMGMYWLAKDGGWWWYNAPIETQALMIEAYEEVSADRERVEDLKVWLIKQKQTQNWKTTKATADAVYALLLRGTSQLASNQLVSVQLGGSEIKPQQTEAGTGFYEESFLRGEIQPEMGVIKVTKRDEGVAWGAVHWQYLEDIANVTAHEGTALQLRKSLYRKVNTEKGPVIEKVDGPINVGDEIVVRVELRTDRDMEYVHLKDYRGSGTEPVNVLSRYKYQDGLAYYESTKDTASHFFIDYLPRGTYVFEYSVRVQHRGSYESGIAELQCMYAPEFNSHSQSVTMEVQ